MLTVRILKGNVDAALSGRGRLVGICGSVRDLEALIYATSDDGQAQAGDREVGRAEGVWEGVVAYVPRAKWEKIRCSGRRVLVPVEVAIGVQDPERQTSWRQRVQVHAIDNFGGKCRFARQDLISPRAQRVWGNRHA